MPSGRDSDLTINSFLIPRNRAVFGVIRLKSGTSISNYYASLTHNFLLGFILCSIEILQKNLLMSPDYYAETLSQQVSTNSSLMIADLASRKVFFPLYGILIDRYGRRRMNVIAFVNIAVAILLYPIRYYDSSLFGDISPWLYIVRVIYASGSSGLVVMPFLGDYIENEHKGRAMAINTTFFSIGTISSTCLINLLSNHLHDVFYLYMILLVIPVIGVISSLFLRRGTNYYQMTLRQYSPILNGFKRYQYNPLKVVLRTIRRRPWITVGFIFSFIGGVDLGLIYQGLFPAGMSLDAAFNFPPDYSLISASVMILIIEILLDFCNPAWIIYPVLILGVVGFTSAFVNVANSTLGHFLNALFFISFLACLSIVSYIDAKHCPRMVRGHSYGLKVLAVAVGIFVVTLCNQYIFPDNPTKIIRMAFGCNFLGLIVLPIIYFKYLKKWENIEERKKATGIRTLLSIEGVDKEMLENSEMERNLLYEVRPDDSSYARVYEEPVGQEEEAPDLRRHFK